jgi:hypothetical protein
MEADFTINCTLYEKQMITSYPSLLPMKIILTTKLITDHRVQYVKFTQNIRW